MNPFVLPCKVAMVTELHGNFTFLVMLDTEPKAASLDCS